MCLLARIENATVIKDNAASLEKQRLRVGGFWPLNPCVELTAQTCGSEWVDCSSGTYMDCRSSICGRAVNGEIDGCLVWKQTCAVFLITG